MEKAIVIGATSGIGQEVAHVPVQQGQHIGIAGGCEDVLLRTQQTVLGQIEIQCFNATKSDAALHLNELIDRLGGMDLFLLNSGVGSRNRSLEPGIELNAARTNVEGFIRMITAAFHHFKETGGGHIAVISSIADTRGLGITPVYSTTKRFQNICIDALTQLSRVQKFNVRFIGVHLGFVTTDLLRNGRYPMLVRADKVTLCIVRSLERKERTIVVNRRYRLLIFF